MEYSRPKGEGIFFFSFPHQSLFTTTSFLGCIAQLVEHWAFNLMVAGSSPAIPKTYLTLYYL